MFIYLHFIQFIHYINTLLFTKTFFIMKKRITLFMMMLSAMLMALPDLAAAANEGEGTALPDGEKVIYSWPSNASAANSVTLAEGVTVAITGNTAKNVSNGKSITIDGTEYTSMKVSNGAQNTLTLPKKAAAITFYSYINKASDATGLRDSYWKEVAGVSYDAETSGGLMTCYNDDLSSPDVRSFVFSEPLDAITFTNTGEQACYVIEVIYASEETQPVADALVVVPETAEQQDWTIEGAYKSSSTNKPVQRVTKVAFDGSDIYVQGLYDWNPATWVKGTIADGKATFASGQLIFDAEGEKYYMLGSNDGETVCDVVFAYDAETQTLDQETAFIFLNYGQKDAINQEYLEWWQFTKLYAGAPIVEEPVTAPEDLQTEQWKFTTTVKNLDETTEESSNKVQVGIDGDDLYIQGIAELQLWVKATKNAEGQYVIPALQYMGEVGFWAKTKYYFTAVDAEGKFADAVFYYDAEAQSLTTDQQLLINKSKNELQPMFTFVGPTSIFKPQPVIVDALPYSNALNAAEGEDAFTIIDANADNSTWRFETDRASIGYTNSADVPHDDWLVSPAIKLEAGKNYQFTIDAWRSSTSGTESFEVKLAAANTAVALAAGTQLIEKQNIEPTEATAYAGETVTVAETGYYYFGIHATSPGDQYGFSVKNFSVAEVQPVDEDVLVTVPETAELQDWTFEGTFNTNSGSINKKFAVKVAIVGNDVYAQGFSYYFPEAYLKGNIDGNTVTFASGQFVGQDEYGKEYMLGLASDGQTICDIVFDYDAATQKMTLSSTSPFIAENANSRTELSMYGYWDNVSLTAGISEVPQLVVLPEGAVVEEYNLSYEDSNGNAQSKPVNVAIVENKLYVQGMSQYLPESWVVGTIDGTSVTFAPMQYMGDYGSYGQSYYFYGEKPVVFEYDDVDHTYSIVGEVYGVLGGKYYDGRYINPLLSKVTEVAATPATPSIEGIESSSYGDVLTFTVPTVDTEGNAMLSSKLSYQFFIDNEETPMVFTPEYFIKLTEEMTVIPYSFTDNYDIQNGYIYLNMPHDTWQQIGIQSIYEGAGEKNKSEIFWFKMPEGPVTAPEDLVTEAYTFNAKMTGNDESSDDNYELMVQVGFDGDDCYIQGLSQDMPELWVKATKNDAGQYVVPANQFMGELNFFGYIIPYYWTGVDAEGKLADAVFDYDATTNTFTGTNQMAINASATKLDYNLLFSDVVITKFEELAATPADPTLESFNVSDQVGYSTIYASIPQVDVDGNKLNTNKLYYIVWIEKGGEQQKYTFAADLYKNDFEEDVVEVPYSHNGYDVYTGGEVIYLEDALEELNSWTKVGLQSVYYGADERRESNIVWLTTTPTGISSVTAAENGNVQFFDMQGRRVSSSQKGLLIMQKRDAEGRLQTVKVMRK